VALEGSRDGWLDYEGLIESESRAFAPVDIDEDDLITINYTSGTTARPKGVMITHRNAYLNVLGTLAHFQMSPEDRYLWTLPMFHANGWTFVWAVTARGSAHVCLRKVDPAMIFELVEREAITTLCAAPTVLIGIANAPDEVRGRAAGRVVRLLTAGAPPAAATIELIERGLGWNVTHIYGLTETAPFILICEELPEHRKLPLAERATVKARQGVELVSSGEIRVSGTSGREVPHDGQSLGEICVRGNVVMKGYFHDPVETVVDGWFQTGDAAVVHPDGYVEIRDRFKDVIISGGENISSVEVESVLLRHDAVQEVSVVGMPHPKWGEAAHAFVVLRPGKPPRRPTSSNSRVSALPTSKRQVGFCSSTTCRRPRRAKYKNTCCVAAGRGYPGSRFPLAPQSVVIRGGGGRAGGDTGCGAARSAAHEKARAKSKESRALDDSRRGLLAANLSRAVRPGTDPARWGDGAARP
jgi:fatty-acyl-CoA synthase